LREVTWPLVPPSRRCGGVWAFLISAALLAVSACGDGSSSEGPVYSGELRVYNWEDYFAPDTLSSFEEEFGVSVQLDTFESEEALLAALQSDPSARDVVVASGSTIQTLLALKLLSPIDPEQVPNLANIQPAFQGLYFDPQGRYSVPYLWGTTGLAVNTRLSDPGSGSWSILWDPKNAGRVGLLDDPQEAFTMALKAEAASGNSSDPLELEAAGRRLESLRALGVRYLSPVDAIDALISEQIWVAQLYNGDALAAADENPDITYLIPKEGAPMWVDNLIIPVDALNQRNAHAFINYILRPEVIAGISEYGYYANPNGPAQDLLPPDLKTNPAVYPSADVLARSELYRERTPMGNSLVNKLWAELRRPER
jgi:spermidine/putrescine-binding protein